MGVVVLDSDVVIGFLNRDDAHHADAVAAVRDVVEAGHRRWLSAVNHAEILVGPARAGRASAVVETLRTLGVETVAVDVEIAGSAAAIRADTGLKLPDAFALATAVHARSSGHADVVLRSFDKRVVAAARRVLK